MTTFDGSAQPISRYAALTGLTTDTVRRCVQKGSIDGFFDGTRWFVSPKEFASALLDRKIDELRTQVVRIACSSPILDRNGFAMDIPEFNAEVERRVLQELRAAFPDVEDWRLLEGYYEMGSYAAVNSPTFGRRPR